MSRKSVFFIMVISMIALLLVASRAHATTAQSLDSAEIIDAQLILDDKPFGEDYLFNASLRFISLHDLNWIIKFEPFSNADFINDSDAVKDYIDDGNITEARFILSGVSKPSGDYYTNDVLLKENVTLRKGKTYGAAIGIFDDRGKLWRQLGYKVYIGSIVKTYYYNSTDWLIPTSDTEKEVNLKETGGDSWEILGDEDPATYVYTTASAYHVALLYATDLSYYTNNYNSTLVNNITVRSSWYTGSDYDSSYRVRYNHPVSNIIVFENLASPDSINYIYDNWNIGVNITDLDWNNKKLYVEPTYFSGSNKIHEVHVKLNVKSELLTYVPAATTYDSGSSSSSDRDLVDQLLFTGHEILLERFEMVILMVLANFQAIIGVTVGISTIIGAYYKISTSREVKKRISAAPLERLHRYAKSKKR